MSLEKRDHGGGLDAAAAAYGGARSDWVDLSTGINPVPYPMPAITADAWTALPDQAARQDLIAAARRFWNVPPDAAILPVPGASAAIAQIPTLAPAGRVWIPAPTYNEHAASFVGAGWTVQTDATGADAYVLVNPNNPNGHGWQASDLRGTLRIIDESFGEVTPDATLMDEVRKPNTLILKSFGKFWGLAGLRLGFVIGDPALIQKLTQMLGPWSVAGPALQIGTAALSDHAWADTTRQRLATDTHRLDAVMSRTGAQLVGGTTLFRLYDIPDAAAFQTRLANRHIWSRTFPYNPRWLRLGLPAPDQWSHLEAALK